MSLKIKDETVYVIYRNGEPYQARGRKLVYTTKGAANGVITNDAQNEAWNKYRDMLKEKGIKPLEHRTNYDVLDSFENEARKEFKVVEYGPKN